MTVTLPNKLTINQVKATYQQIAEVIEAGDALELDLSLVNDIDAAGLQMLIYIKKFFQDNNQQLLFTKQSDAVQAICKTANVSI